MCTSSVAHLSVILDLFKNYFSNWNCIKNKHHSSCTETATFKSTPEGGSITLISYFSVVFLQFGLELEPEERGKAETHLVLHMKYWLLPPKDRSVNV